jgi:hypothetical protein
LVYDTKKLEICVQLRYTIRKLQQWYQITMSEIYHFDWHRDKAGYEIRQPAEISAGSLLIEGSYERICALGGPTEQYRPLQEHPALWRRFAETCINRDGIIPFCNSFGHLDDMGDAVDQVIRRAKTLHVIADYLDSGDRPGAAKVFNEYTNIRLTAKLLRDGLRLALKPIPANLWSAMLIQAAEALTGNFEYRKCLNCPEWMRLGAGSHSKRRMFCCDACRVARHRSLKKVESL